MNRYLVLFLTLIYVSINEIQSEFANYGMPGRIPILMFNSPDQPYSIGGRAAFNSGWNCRFQQDFCNLKNSYHLAQFQRHSDPRSPIFNELSMLYINVTNAGDLPAARLETGYFPASQQFACLSLKYLLYGTGARKMFVIQQDIENKCVWADHNEAVDNYGQWRTTQMTINMRDGNPRFFIEAHIDGRPPNYGTIAISTFTLSYGVCDNDSTNNCQRTDDRPIPPEPTPVK